MTSYPKPLFQLIQSLKKLPGVGQKTAERYAFQLLEWKTSDLKLFTFLLNQLKESLSFCKECGCLQEIRCDYCLDPNRQNGILCIVSNSKDVFSINETKSFYGLFHVLPNLLNPFDADFDKDIYLKEIVDRIKKHKITEIILALESTLEGDATALFLKEQLSYLGVTLSRLAFGIPIGSTLEYIDGGTLSRALIGRQPI